MKKDDIKIEKISITAKPRRLSTQWTMEPPISKEELNKLKQDSLDAYDTWVWDTGTDEDKEKYKKLEKRLKYEIILAKNQAEIDDIMSELAAGIRDEIDKDILERLIKGGNNE